MTTLIEALKQEAERVEEDVLYSEKQHFAMATIWRRVHYWLGLPSALLAALAGISALRSYPDLAATLAVGSVVLTSLLTFLQPEKIATNHHDAGVQYSGLRGRLRRARNIDALEPSEAASIKAEISKIAAEKLEIAKSAPHIGGLAYKLGKASILRGEHAYKADTEKRA